MSVNKVQMPLAHRKSTGGTSRGAGVHGGTLLKWTVKLSNAVLAQPSPLRLFLLYHRKLGPLG